MFFGEPCRETPKDDANNFFKNSQITTQFYVQKKKSQNATQIIEIIKKRNKISLNGRSLTSFSDWCKHCNMLGMWFFFSFCFSAQWLLFFWACYFFLFPRFCCLEVSPIATCYHFLFTDTHGFEVEGKYIVIQWKRAWQRYQPHPSFNPIFWFSANIICTCSVSCHRSWNNFPPRVQIFLLLLRL